MTRLFNDPTAFADEMIEGFVAAFPEHVRAVPGGVVRATRSAAGSVAVVTGGGSGHYPAFGGLVGQGLASGAAMGGLFASPSSQQVHGVARAAQRGGGVLLTYGRYAGDVLNFDAAQERLRAEGIDCRTVTVTDDVASAPPEERHRRRGIAGGLVVYKTASAAADAGYSLDDVERVAALANERTRSFGVAFSGCTMPGADRPLVDVPEGRMAVGLGIHGEPGLELVDLPTADELAERFVTRLLTEVPDGAGPIEGARVAVVLNGLGTVKYEELFVVYRAVARLLADRGLEVAHRDVGEFCTSLDMAGASLTLVWLDEELEQLWSAPCDAPAFRRGRVEPTELLRADEVDTREDSAAIPDASEASRGAAARVLAAIEATAAVIDDSAEELGRIDAIAGDGDHGIGMQRGVRAAVRAAAEVTTAGAGAGTVLTRAADAWSDRAGGTSGALWGVMLRALGAAVGDADAPTASSVSAGVTDALAGIQKYGKAEVGDKTMVDAIVPFAETLAARVGAGDRLAVAWVVAAEASTTAAAATADLLPKMGRARTHHEKSLGTPDAGAHSFALIVTAIGGTLIEGEK